jgi:hypothetical protein
MIVRERPSGVSIIFQRNHALLAGELAMAIHENYRPPRWTETLTAIVEHDDGQRDWQYKNHLSEEGRPLDFTEYSYDLQQAKRVVTEASHKSQWITMMVSMHVSALYSEVENQSPALRQFLEEQKNLQAKLGKRLQLGEDRRWHYYQFLRWCDECSLILCQGRYEKNQGKVKIGKLGVGLPLSHLYHYQTGEMSVEPWCFARDEFEVTAEIFSLKQKTFNSDQELKKKIEETVPEQRVWTFKRTKQ